MTWIIDRIEDNMAVIEPENTSVFSIPLTALPNGVKEGDVLELSVNQAETENRKEKIDKLMNSLFED